MGKFSKILRNMVFFMIMHKKRLVVLKGRKLNGEKMAATKVFPLFDLNCQQCQS